MILTSGSRPGRARPRRTARGDSRARGGRLGPLIVALLTAAALLFPAAALADEPFRVATQLEDRAGVVGDRQSEVRAALDDLQGSERVQLWVVFVDTFSSWSAQEWAHETARVSDLGLRDLLLAVAVEDRAYAYSADQDFPLSQEQLDEVMTVAVEPALSADDWAAAVTGSATGIAQALEGEAITAPEGPSAGDGGSGPIAKTITALGILVPLFVIVVIAVAVWFIVRRSRRGRAGHPAGAGAGQPKTLDELRREASVELVHTDDAIKTSTEELGFAVAQFGDEQAAPFQQALDEAERELDEAFRLHRQLDAAADEPAQRELLKAVLAHTAAANEKLDAQAERFDRLRDLEKQAPKVLAELQRQLTDLESRLPAVRSELASLAAAYAPAALAAVAGNPDEVAARLAFAREQVSAGNEDVVAGRSGEAAVAAAAAQEAASQAQAMLDAVGRLGKDVAEAQQRIDAAVAETRRDIAEARAAGSGGELPPLVAAAEAAVAAAAGAAAPEGGRDPLAALRHLEEADAALEQELQEVRDEQAHRARAVAALERTIPAARAELAAADDYITTHRGAVGSGPRELLAEAQGRLDQAVAMAVSDPVTAAEHAAGAHEGARRAFSEAQAEAAPSPGMPGLPGGPGVPRMPGTGGSFGGGLGGAILGGILTEMMRGGSGGGFGGGFGGGSSGGSRRSSGGGGFGRPSFGGGGTRMRRGGGGRF